MQNLNKKYMNTYYILMANKHFLFNYEPVEEVIRERYENYKNRNLNFKLITEDDKNFFSLREIKNMKKLIPNEAIAIISNDSEFIDWLKLRLTYVIKDQIETELFLI
uniref:Hypothetical chloroplast RF54 n=1 Tax=Galdieria sulphuraria TaxID=130081 RepID=A0A075W3R2_GALSU|nr:hypothetical chloroplast RF54 [Galdieria sulphuraria]AIG92610.1 hypothetical chloroplast RF54 [Galdieria sulphuraria]